MVTNLAEALPADGDPIPGLVELLFAIGLVLLGLWRYRRRDLTPN
jgi:MYXO-CTERM domain-containing protein